VKIPENKVWARALVAGQADTGSIIIVVATDAPLLPHQMKRLHVLRTGYVEAEYGQRGPSGPGTMLSLSAGQHLRDISFR